MADLCSKLARMCSPFQRRARPLSPNPSHSQNPPGRSDGMVTDLQLESGVGKPDDASTDRTPETNSLPESEWEINNQDVSELRSWYATHGKSKLTQFWGKADDALKSGPLVAALEFIPDTPVPAKTLVKALLGLVQLGIKSSILKKNLYAFTEDAIEYINLLLSATQSEESVKEGLRAVFQTVNQICDWANQQVHKLNPSETQLNEWGEKLARAKENLLATSVIQLLVKEESKRRAKFIKQKLSNHIANKYEHTDQRKPFCAEGTREQLFADLQDWLTQPSGAERIFWITGIPGSGKSTILATFVDRLRKRNTPVFAQYFISRNVPDTTDPHKLIPTIAKQVAESSPSAARAIEDVLKNGFPSTQEEQFQSLLLRPIQAMAKSHNVLVIAIDALDELRDAGERATQFLSAITSTTLPDEVRFVITSRPDISKSTELKQVVLKQRFLDTENSKVEVGTFIRTRMKEIICARIKEFPSQEKSWRDWPSESQLQILSSKADGLFHFAATALEWIKTQMRDNGTACQKNIFERVELASKVDGLYELILSSWVGSGSPDQQDNRLNGFRHVVGCVLVLKTSQTIGQIIELLSDIPSDSFDVLNFFQRMRSVLIPTNIASIEEATPQMHKSFRDYICSDRCDDKFKIWDRDAHFATAKSCLEVIVKAKSSSNSDCAYAFAYWHQHLRLAVEKEHPCEDEKIWGLLRHIANDGMQEEHITGLSVWENVVVVGWLLYKKDNNIDRGKLATVSGITQKIKNLLKEKERLAVQEERLRRRFFEFQVRASPCFICIPLADILPLLVSMNDDEYNENDDLNLYNENDDLNLLKNFLEFRCRKSGLMVSKRSHGEFSTKKPQRLKRLKLSEGSDV